MPFLRYIERMQFLRYIENSKLYPLLRYIESVISSIYRKIAISSIYRKLNYPWLLYCKNAISSIYQKISIFSIFQKLETIHGFDTSKKWHSFNIQYRSISQSRNKSKILTRKLRRTLLRTTYVNFMEKTPKKRLQQSSEVTPYVCLQISCVDMFYAFGLVQQKCKQKR